MVEEAVKAGDGIDGEVTIATDPAVLALFLRLKKDLKVLPGDGVRAEEADGDPTNAATCFRLLRVHVRR